MLTLARVVRLIATVVFVIIVAGILLRVFDANMSNAIVSDIHDAAAWLVGPFKNLFSFKNPKVTVAVNWGIAAVVYYAIGHVIARLLARASTPRRGVAPVA
jgi:hypothetical protein